MHWSPDGRRLVSGSEDLTLRVWDSTTLASVLSIGSHADQVQAVRFAPDGASIASGGADKMLVLWDNGDIGNPVLRSASVHDGVSSIDWSPSGSHLVVAMLFLSPALNTIELFDATLSTGMSKSAAATDGYATGSSLWSVAFSPDGTRIASISYAGKQVSIYNANDLASGPLLSAELLGLGYVVKWSPDGSRLATGTTYAAGSKSFKLWRSSDMALLDSAMDDRTSSLAWSPDGRAPPHTPPYRTLLEPLPRASLLSSP